MRLAVFVPLLALPGCLDFGKVDDAKTPGDLLGVFSVRGELEESNCGDGALGATDSWDFQVKLSRFEHDLYWLNGKEAIVGSIASNGRSFSFESGVAAAITPDHGAQKGCSVTRTDRANGELSDSGKDVASFDGTLEFVFHAADGADCSAWIGTEGAVSELPCTMRYAMSGKRTQD